MTEKADADQMMLQAIVKRDVERLAEALRQGANPNGDPSYPNRPLHAAAIKGPVESVDVLLRNGADVDAEGVEGRTPLHMVCIADCGEAEMPGIARRLLAAGANVNARDEGGRTPLDDAAGTQRIELAKALIEAGGTCAKRYHGWIRNVAPDAAFLQKQRRR